MWYLWATCLCRSKNTYMPACTHCCTADPRNWSWLKNFLTCVMCKFSEFLIKLQKKVEVSFCELPLLPSHDSEMARTEKISTAL